MENILADLQQLGFSSKEAAVYVALLRLGEVGTSKIISATGLHGQFVYNALKTLEQKGFVMHTVHRGRKKFRAKHPATIVRQAERATGLAKNVVATLDRIMMLSPERKYEIIQGVEEFQQLQIALYRNQPVNSEVLLISGAGKQYIDAMDNAIVKTARLRKEKNIRIRHIGGQQQKHELRISGKVQDDFTFRFLSDFPSGIIGTNIWHDAMSFNIFGEPLTCFVIRNKKIVDNYRQLFEVLWKLSEKGN